MAAWYPPAESRLTWSEILCDSANDARQQLGEQLKSATGFMNCSLGSDAKSLMYQCLLSLKNTDDQRRDCVLLPAYTCYTVAAAAVKAGLRIRLYDVDADSLQADMSSLEQAMQDDVLAVVSQHLFGLVSDVAPIQHKASQLGSWHIEDAAQAFGSRRRQTLAGTTGDFCLYSFGRGKALPVGGGGALLSRQPLDFTDLLEADHNSAQRLKNIITRIASQPRIYGFAERLPLGLGETHFDTSFEPAGITRYQASLALRVIARLEILRQHRLRIAGIYKDRLQCQQISIDDFDGSNFTRYPLLARAGEIPQQLRQLGVRRMYPQALCDVLAISDSLVDTPKDLPGSRDIADRLITLPTHSSIDAGLAQRVSDTVNAWLSV